MNPPPFSVLLASLGLLAWIGTATDVGAQADWAEPLDLPQAVAYNDFDDNPFFSQDRYFESGTTMRESILPLLLPFEHPIRPILDAIFTASRPTADPDSLAAAGFTNNVPGSASRTVVSTHPLVPGYLFKLMYDREDVSDLNHKKAWIYLYKRAFGARAVREVIDRRRLSRFTIPRKWLYPLPLEPVPQEDASCHRSYLIVVEDCLQLEPLAVNQKAWKQRITPDHLLELYWIIRECGLGDMHINNIALTTDGRFAFIDLEHCLGDEPDFARVRPFLSKQMRRKWDRIIAHGGRYW